MSRTQRFRRQLKKKPNPLGICHCAMCKWGRSGTRSSVVMKLRQRERNWWNNRPLKKGAYTD